MLPDARPPRTRRKPKPARRELDRYDTPDTSPEQFKERLLFQQQRLTDLTKDNDALRLQLKRTKPAAPPATWTLRELVLACLAEDEAGMHCPSLNFGYSKVAFALIVQAGGVFRRQNFDAQTDIESVSLKLKGVSLSAQRDIPRQDVADEA